MFQRSFSRILGTGLAAAACLVGASSAVHAQNKNQLVIGYLQFVPNNHPLIQVNNTKLWLMGFIQRPITAVNPVGENTCMLCTTVPSLENGLAKIVDLPDGKKGMQVTIKLRPNANWGDGKPVVADDIVLTHKMATSGIGFSNFNTWQRASKVEVVDPKTVILHLPEVGIGYDTWDHVLPSHLEAPIYEKFKTTEEYVKQSLYNRETTNPGLWNGPFMVTSADIGVRITLDANPHASDKPNLQRIIFSYRDKSPALLQNLLSGDVEGLSVSPGGISFAQFLQLRKEHPDRFQYMSAPDQTFERLAFQLDNPILKDVRVRRAVAHGIDRETISKRLFDGLQPVGHSILVTFNANYSDAVTKYPYDPAKAKALLAEAGWKPGPDGICVNAKGEKLSFELETLAGNETRSQVVQVMQSQLKTICIDTPIKLAPNAVFNGEDLRKRQFKGLVMSTLSFVRGASPSFILGSEGIPTEANSWTGNNFSGYASKAMDAALAEVDGTLDPKKAKEGWAKVQKIASDDLPVLPLFYYTYGWVMPKDFGGMDMRRYDQPSIWSHQWTRK